MSQRVLVPMDFKPGSERALEWAVDYVRDRGGALDVLHVVPRLHQLDPFFRAGSLPSQSVAAIRERAAERLAQLLRHKRVRYHLHVVEGDPATRIAEQAAALHPSIIVVGTSGRSSAARLFLGSVAEKIVHASTVPVVTVPMPASK
jgi:nucleotide-binding universal stress UspA family protein